MNLSIQECAGGQYHGLRPKLKAALRFNAKNLIAQDN
jgi:hypothetical protein